MPGLVVRKDNGDLRWYPFFKQDDKYTFYPSKDHGQRETGTKVGRGFNFEKYLPGYWMPGGNPKERRIGGGNSLVVLEKDGDLKFYRFEDETFLVGGTGKKVGKGFKPEWDYYIAEWTGNGTSDLLVRDEKGELRLFPWDGKEFRDLGRDEDVGVGFDKEKYPDLLPGYWRGGEFPDLVVREENGSMWLYPFNGKDFRKSGDRDRIGRGFDLNTYTHLLVGEWMQNGTPDLIVRHENGQLKRYIFIQDGSEFKFADGPYETVGRGFHDDWTYLVGYWRFPGKPDLILRDDDNNMRFYPFDDGEFTDLPRGDKNVGKGWKFTHMWDFYPV